MKKLIILTCFFILSCIPAFTQKTIPVDTSYTPYSSWMKIKKNYPEAKIAYNNLPAGVNAHYNLVYATLPETPFGRRDLHLDLFRPDRPGKFPVLVMIHGGGWRSGNKSMQVPMAQKIAALGFVTVAVEYQLSLEAKYPAAIHNIKAAIRWLRANANKYGIDTSWVAVSGCSAGGQLAALIGMTNGVPQMEGDMGFSNFSSKVNAVLDIDGVISFLTPASLNITRKPDSPDVAWLGGTFSEKPDTWKDASSIFWANKNSVPVLFINSGFSRFHAGQDELIGMMKEWGIYTEVHKFDVQVHPFWLFYPWVDTTVNYMVDFMNKVRKE
jgi:acetyl esterase/lipase